MRFRLPDPRRVPSLALVALALLLACAVPSAATTITVVNLDGAGEGFNDATPASPVGGNPATTVGAQRLYLFEYAANIWEAQLPSNVEIRVQASFNPLSCSPDAGVLGSAGPVTAIRDFSGALLTGHWYHVALANRLSGVDLSAGNDISSQFNSSVGQPGCLETTSWYYGVDGLVPPDQLDLLGTVLHELGHGLGFSTTTNGANGAQANGFPHVYDHFLYDNLVGLHWDQMSGNQRSTSAEACTRLVWDGAITTQQAPSMLGDKPVLRINSPGGIAGDYEVGTATFGPPLSGTAVTQDVVLANDGSGTATDACEALVNGGAIAGKIALVDRGTCPFTQKVKNAQDAGAIAVLVADNVAVCPPDGLGGSDPTITIPSVRITLANGNTIKANLPGVNASLVRDPTLLAGTDGAGRVKMYSPSSYSAGSSVSHFDVTADPDLLMEPFATPLEVGVLDLTQSAFVDIGWYHGTTSVDGLAPAPRLLKVAPNPFGRSTTVSATLERGARAELSVFDLGGRRLVTLHRGMLPAGSHSFEWNGRDDAGRQVPPGFYVSRLEIGDIVEIGRMVKWQ